MENYSKWDDEEIKTLFKFVEIKKQEGMPLIKIFAEYATKTLRHANSVRNYYYKELGNMLNNTKIADDFGINLKNHTITQSQPFSQNEELQVVNQINELKEQGYLIPKDKTKAKETVFIFYDKSRLEEETEEIIIEIPE